MKKPMEAGLASAIALLVCVAAAWGADAPATPATPAPTTAPEMEKTLTLDLGGGVNMEFVLIPAGEFMMGEVKGDVDETPYHKVTFTKAFYMGKCETTQEQWKAVMGTEPSKFKGDKNPVDSVSWKECMEFAKKLDEKFAERKLNFSLPTEAQWEYACRAGTTTKFSFGDKDADMADYGWCKLNAEGTTHPAGLKKPNAWGLYDMHGNVVEWTYDWFDKGYYAASPEKDPTGPETGTQHVLRGGCWFHGPDGCRCTDRSHYSEGMHSQYFGFRAVCTK